MHIHLLHQYLLSINMFISLRGAEKHNIWCPPTHPPPSNYMRFVSTLRPAGCVTFGMLFKSVFMSYVGILLVLLSPDLDLHESHMQS